MNNGLLKITEYKGYLIIALLDRESPKVTLVGTGTLVSGFNHNDVLMSSEALILLSKNAKMIKLDNMPALEIISKDRLWWSTVGSIIIPPDEIINAYSMPYHTKCENEIDSKLKEQLDNI